MHLRGFLHSRSFGSGAQSLMAVACDAGLESPRSSGSPWAAARRMGEPVQE